MNTSRQRHRFTKWSLALVWWVICVCLANNIGLLNACPVKYQDDNQVIQQVLQNDDQVTNNTDIADKCSLSEHLINFDQHQVADHALIMQILALVLILWLLSTSEYRPSPTTPTLYKGRRLHLQLCVFRE
ncbi:copper resistance protein [Vibrio sp. TRT 21S02]|uniref:copper resistance protein n=1 Tax=Vibrio sp. TRT 21S02 TaxID=3418507 RepID=UPI003CF1F1BE